ncbi:hypothetical protein F5984_17410 [Rudanella paleaurantiibacter]|uniref:Uncharacterized protein n=1 Tax=Rudanella paleaurantiibacter TaxID=2614655 RepID=A0A7J5TW48_9BACT|nr:hypothetical protein [Rudanella paleaurantiibacter]KAB7728619.1 hypothetical protein F5984_17410 [Rudanella paleaurantiibacter]
MKLHNYFRPTGNLSLFGAFLFMVYGASYRPQSTVAGIVDHYKVGDVVHSILAPADFYRMHGGMDPYGEPKWRLMTGQLLSANTDLRKLFSSQLINGTNLPDARGVFLRGMNEDRSTGSGDAAGNRGIGTYQSDEFKAHNHRTDILVKWGNWSYGGNNWATQWGDGQVTGNTGGAETP